MSTDQTPTLPDTDVLERLHESLNDSNRKEDLYAEVMTGDLMAVLEWLAELSPPPAEPEPWSGISTNPAQPTLGRVKWKRGGPAETRFMYRSAECLFDSDADEYVGELHRIEYVELLHVVTPELLDYTLHVYREAGREDTDGYRALLSLATGANQ